MSFSTHHGASGSLKTFSVVQRFLIPALYEGRTVVTNIRGVNIQNIEDIMKKPIPPMAEMIFVDWEDPNCPANVDLLARWFHWIPFGALFILDECHNFYPEDTKTFLNTLSVYDEDADYYIEPDEKSIISNVDGREYLRPKDILNAFRMHRHFLWDIIFTTPDIDFVPKKIRLSNEYCYRHRNLSGIVPWKKNKWKEVQHSARNTGESISSSVGTVEYDKDKRIFDCYQSTTTGQYNESIAGKSVFGGAKIKVVLFFFLCSFSYLVYGLADKLSVSDTGKNNSINLSLSKADNNENFGISDGFNINESGSEISVSDVRPSVVKKIKKPFVLPFNSKSISISGSIAVDGKPTKYIFMLTKKDGSKRMLTQGQLIRQGYKVYGTDLDYVVIKKRGRVEPFPVYLKTLVSKNNKEKGTGLSSFASNNNNKINKNSVASSGNNYRSSSYRPVPIFGSLRSGTAVEKIRSGSGGFQLKP